MDRRARNTVICLALAFIVSGCESVGAASGKVVRAPTPMTTRSLAMLSALKASGVTGKVEMALSGDELDVMISLSGLSPNQEHMQHIHGAHGTLATCPTAASAN